MWKQILAIVWAQFRIARNHLPRTTVGGPIMWFLTSLWYAAFAVSAIVLAFTFPGVPFAVVEQWLPVGLLGVFLYWQVVPLLTMSTGWELQLNKLQIYPVRDSAMLAIEVLLRITASPETIVLVLGATAGLLFHPDVRFGAPLLLLLFIPFNLFVQLAVRNLVTVVFDRSRFREILAIVFVAIGVLPQLALRTGLGRKLEPYFFLVAQGPATPWRALSAASLGALSPINFFWIACWIALSLVWARLQFRAGLTKEDTFRGAAKATPGPASSLSFLPSLTGLFRDPMANLLQKELQSLLRMPRFRVVFGMACVFGVVVFVPMTLGRGGAGFIKNNFLPVVNLYGMLMLSDVLLLNVFGLDRKAAQLYFVTPVSLRAVFRAKNTIALSCIALQTVVVFLCALLFRIHLDWFGVGSGAAVTAVVAVFLLAAGNMLSVTMPRAIDPASTLKKQAGAKGQLWVLLCSVGMLFLVAIPFLARWAAGETWPFFAVLFLELVIGMIFYWVALDSAVERGLRDRERIIDTLSKGASPIAF